MVFVLLCVLLPLGNVKHAYQYLLFGLRRIEAICDNVSDNVSVVNRGIYVPAIQQIRRLLGIERNRGFESHPLRHSFGASPAKRGRHQTNTAKPGSNAVRVPFAAKRLKSTERSERFARIEATPGSVPFAAKRLKSTECTGPFARIGGEAGNQSHPLRHSFPLGIGSSGRVRNLHGDAGDESPGYPERSLLDAGAVALHRAIILLLACVVLATTSCTRHHLSDTPAARRELARSVVGYEDQEIAGKPWIDYASERTAYLIPGDDVQSPERGVFVLDPLRGAGRGAALTRDGYYLTANHVVDATDNPGLLDFSRAPGVHRGRVVKRFEAADLALVKFDFRPRAWFSDWQEGPVKGEHVFAAAATDQWQQEPLSGNGGFEASGDAIEVLPIRGGEAYGAMAAKTTLPARGGMSGAPLVDAEGRLVGIMLESRDAPLRPPGFKISVSGMISPDVLEKLVKEDRRGKR